LKSRDGKKQRNPQHFEAWCLILGLGLSSSSNDCSPGVQREGKGLANPASCSEKEWGKDLLLETGARIKYGHPGRADTGHEGQKPLKLESEREREN